MDGEKKQDEDVRIPRTCDYVTVHGKRGSADVRKERILRCKHSVLPRWPQYKGPCKRTREAGEYKKM